MASSARERSRAIGLATTAPAVNDLRTSAEKAINLDAIKTAVEPYLAHVKEYRSTVTDRAESLISGVKSDKRVTKLDEQEAATAERTGFGLTKGGHVQK